MPTSLLLSEPSISGTLVATPTEADDRVLVIDMDAVEPGDSGFRMNAWARENPVGERKNPSWNLGHNCATTGQVDPSDHAWYLQMETYWNPAGEPYAEWHLNYHGVNGEPYFRPFMVTTKTNSHYTVWTWQADDFEFFKPGTTRPALRVYFDNDHAYTNLGDPGPGSTNHLIMFGGGKNHTLFKAGPDTSVSTVFNGDWIVRSGPQGTIYFKNGAFDNVLVLQNDKSVEVTGDLRVGGKLRTAQAASNPNTPSGPTAYQWPLYKPNGELLGYVPVYTAPW